MRIPATIAALLLLLAPGPAAAQAPASASIDEVRKNARIHEGPLYLTPSVALKELGVDSNVFNAAGDQLSDFTFTVAPAANLWLPVARRALLRATLAADLVWYAEYDTERSIDPQATVRLETYLNRLTLFAQNAYLNTRQRDNYEIDLRSRHVANNLLAGAELRLTRKFSVEVAGRRFDSTYDADAEFDGTNLRQTLDRTTTGVEAAVRHRLTPLTTLSVRYDNLRDAFEYSPARDSTSFRVMPGVEFTPRALVSGTAHVGYRRFTPTEPDLLPAFSGLVADLGLSYTMFGSTTFGVSYRRDLTYSYEVTQPFFVANSVGASVRRALGRRFDLLFSADRHRYDYQELAFSTPNASQVPLAPRIDTTWNYAGSIGYRVGRAGRIGFGVSYWQRESTTKQFRDYDNLRIGSTATYGF